MLLLTTFPKNEQNNHSWFTFWNPTVQVPPRASFDLSSKGDVEAQVDQATTIENHPPPAISCYLLILVTWEWIAVGRGNFASTPDETIDGS